MAWSLFIQGLIVLVISCCFVVICLGLILDYRTKTREQSKESKIDLY